jgi:methionine-rich copper-binding protein CopC
MIIKKTTMSKAKKNFGILVVCLGTLFIGCNKQPSADFSTDKTEYTAGDVVKCTNKSLSSKSCKWTFPDGQTSASTNVNYTLDENTPAGVYSIKLQAISKKGNKTSDATKSFTVKDAMGQLTVWTSNSAVNPISVKIDNVSLGTITVYYNSSPGCSANGCVTANLTIGTHTINATDGTLNWNTTATITKNSCKVLELQ